MRNISKSELAKLFALEAEYAESEKEHYNQECLRVALDLNNLKPLRDDCNKICPISMSKKISTRDARSNFVRNQFMYYIETKRREYQQKGFNLAKCIENPSERYLDLYSGMINEIQRKVSSSVRLSTDNPTSVGLVVKSDTKDCSEDNQSNTGWYDESIHTIQQYLDLIMWNIIPNFDGMSTCDIDNRFKLFLQKLEELNIERRSTVLPDSYWDELYLRLNFARCMYWEFDLLQSYQEVLDIIQGYYEPTDEGNASKYSYMVSEVNRGRIFEDDCYLLFEEETDKPGCRRIVERECCIDSDQVTADNMTSYLNALRQYIENHIDEIARSVFYKEKVTKDDKKKILTRFNSVCEYIQIEYERYTRFGPLLKSRLIAIFQMCYLCLDQSGILKKKKGSPKRRDFNGNLRKEKNTWSSTLSSHVGKEPLYFQHFCIWGSCHLLWNLYSKLFVQLYLEMNIDVLKLLCAESFLVYEKTGDLIDLKVTPGMQTIQYYAEEILFLAAETLIPDEVGQAQTHKCICKLTENGLKFWTGYLLKENLFLSKFGKYCKLFGEENVIKVIQRALGGLGAPDTSAIYVVPLNNATGRSVREHTLSLVISYDVTSDTYALTSFNILNENPMRMRLELEGEAFGTKVLRPFEQILVD